MGAADIDRIEIGVEAQATKANRALDALAGKLEKLSASVGKVSGSDFTGFANGIEKICKASAGMSNIKSTDFTRLSKIIEKITSINAGSMNATSSALGMMAKQLSSFGAASANAAGIGEIAKNISKLGNKGVVSAIDNMPKFATALSQMMTTLSKAPQMSKNLVDMTNALANLAASVKGTQAATSKTGNNVSNLSKLFNTLTSSTNRSSRSFKSFSQIAGSFYANFFMITRGMQKAWKAVMSSMDYVETFNYWNVALDKIGTEFGKNFEQYGYDSAEAYANSFSNRIKSLTLKMTGYEIGDAGDLSLTGNKNLGLDPEQLMNYQAKIISVTNAVGLCGEISANTAKALSMLSADMSSYTNEDLSSVMTNFQSGLIGQSRALYKFGIDITNATLQQYAYNIGVTKSLSAMTQAEKMQLRLIAILDQSKVAWGDQANTLGSVANQYRIMKQQISNLARTLGNLLLPIVKNVLPVINALVMALNRLFTTLGLHFFGSNWLKDLQDGTSKGYGDGLEDLGDDADDAAGGLNDAASAAKKLKDYVADIDELNINNPNTDSGSSSSGFGAGGIDLSGAISDALKDYETVWDKAFAESENKAQQIADRICDAFKRGDYEGIGTYISNGISSALEKIQWESVYGVADNFGTGLAQFLNGLVSPRLFGDVGTTIAGALNTAIHAALSFGLTFDWVNLGESIAAGINNFFATFNFEDAAKTVNTWANGLLDLVESAVRKIDWEKAIEGAIDFTLNLDIEAVLKLTSIAVLWKNRKNLLNLAEKGLISLFTGGINLENILLKVQKISLFAGTPTFDVLVSDIWDKISQAVERNMSEKGFEILSKIGAGISVGAVTGSWFPGAGTIAGAIVGGISGALDSITIDNESILQKIFNLDATAYSFKIAGDFFVKIKDDFAKKDWASIGSDILNGIGYGLWGIVSFPVEPIADLFQFIWDEISNKFGIQGGSAEAIKPLGEGIGQGVIDGFTSKYEEFDASVQTWYENHIQPWFTTEKWSSLAQGMKDGISKKWEEFKTWWSNTGFSKWWKDVSSYFTTEKWTWTGIKDGLVQAWNNAIESIKQIWNKFANWLNEKLTFSWDAVTVAGKELVPAGSVTLGKIPTFAEGGFPETGQLFMARENGINELVGQIGNRSAVVNNDQIVESVSRGVASGIADANSIQNELLREQNELLRMLLEKDLSVNFDDRDIFRASERGRKSVGMRLRTT